MIFDTHAHYDDKQFDIDRDEIIKETLKDGVSNFIVAGYNVNSSKKAIEIENLREYTEKTNSLLFSNPTLAKEWHYEKNESNSSNSLFSTLVFLCSLRTDGPTV